MPIPFERFRLLNGSKKEVENVSFQRALFVRVDGQTEVIVPPGERIEIPDGYEIDITAEEILD
jgi:hypothetical protein